MEITSLPPNVYHRLFLVGNAVIAVNSPLPGGKETDPKVWLIVFTPARTDSEIVPGDEERGEVDGETRWTYPAKYHVLMREHDGQLGDVMQVHEVWADKVLVASRIASRDSAIDEFTALLKEELGDDAKVDLQDFSKRPNGQQAGATP